MREREREGERQRKKNMIGFVGLAEWTMGGMTR
jgi:hypothetical protein